jgi:hypothetical protein
MLRVPPEFPAAAGALVEAGFAIALFVRDRRDTHVAMHAGSGRGIP